MKKSLRLILSAYQCGPGMGSVSAIGWQWYSRLAAQIPVTLVTHVRNRQALLRAGAPVPQSEVLWIDTEWFAGPLYRLAAKAFSNSEHALFLISSLDFFVYDRLARKTLERHIQTGEGWDLIHAVTPVSPVAATTLGRLGLPVILGPLNGGLRSPKTFPELMRQDSAWLYPIRNVGKLADAWLGSSRSATLILTATRATLDSVPKRFQARCMPMLENGVDLNLFRFHPWPAPPTATEPLKILFVGRLIAFKALPFLIEAVATVQNEFPVNLTVIGDGPMREAWQRKTNELGLAPIVSFLGARPLEDVAHQMSLAHVFCLPSVRESGGAVLLEAMAAGRPSIVVAYGGPGEIVDDEVGRAIPPLNAETVISGLEEAFRDVVRNPDAWRRRGENGRQRAEQRYGWDAKIARAIEIYEQVLEGRQT